MQLLDKQWFVDCFGTVLQKMAFQTKKTFEQSSVGIVEKDHNFARFICETVVEPDIRKIYFIIFFSLMLQLSTSGGASSLLNTV